MFLQFNMSEEEKQILKKYLRIMGILLILSLVLLIIHHFTKPNGLEGIKKNARRDIVYTQKKEKRDGFTIEVPYLNLNVKNVEAVNQEILDYANTYLKNQKNSISYTFDVSDAILSLVIKVAYYNQAEAEYCFAFKTYNIDLNTMTFLTDDELLKKYQITSELVEKKIKEKFEFFFQDEDSKNYFQDECDYNEFLFLRNVTSYLDDIHYYVKEGKLYVYKPFDIYTIYKENEYYKENDFMFQISD